MKLNITSKTHIRIAVSFPHTWSDQIWINKVFFWTAAKRVFVQHLVFFSPVTVFLCEGCILIRHDKRPLPVAHFTNSVLQTDHLVKNKSNPNFFLKCQKTLYITFSNCQNIIAKSTKRVISVAKQMLRQLRASFKWTRGRLRAEVSLNVT